MEVGVKGLFPVKQTEFPVTRGIVRKPIFFARESIAHVNNRTRTRDGLTQYILSFQLRWYFISFLFFFNSFSIPIWIFMRLVATISFWSFFKVRFNAQFLFHFIEVTHE